MTQDESRFKCKKKDGTLEVEGRSKKIWRVGKV